MFPRAISEEAEHDRWRRSSVKGAIIAHIGPEPGGFRATTSQQRHRGVVAMQPGRGEDMRLDQGVQRLQQLSHSADLVGERGDAEIHAFTGVAFGLSVEGLMLAVFFEDDHGEQAWSCPSPRDRVEGCRGLGDLLAGPARELLPDRLDHLPLARNDLERLGDVLAHLRDAIGPAAGTAAVRLNHHALARQMLREGFLHRLAPLEGADLGRFPLGLHLILGGVRDQLAELQFQLVEQFGAALRAAAILVALEQRDLELEAGDHRLGGRDLRTRPREIDFGRGCSPLGSLSALLGRRKRGAQFFEFGAAL